MNSPLLSANDFDPHADEIEAVNSLRRLKARFRINPRGRVWAVVVTPPFSDEDTQHCLTLQHLLWFRYWGFTNQIHTLSDRGVRKLAEHPALRVFDVCNNNRITDSSMQRVASNPQLQWLAFNGATISNDGVSAFGSGSRLLRLALRETHIDDGCITSLGAIDTLRVLRLENTNISAEGRSHLKSRLPRCRTL
jgi:hypothetical protein